LGENPTEQEKEETRRRIFSVCFKALVREERRSDRENPWEVQVGPMHSIQDKIKKQIINLIEFPRNEMITAIFRRGLENLVTEMKESGWKRIINFLLEKIGSRIRIEQKRLCDTLNIKKMKQELEGVRQTRNVQDIAALELAIAKKIQRAICRFPYKSLKDTDGGPYHPSDIICTRYVNCVGASVLGGGFLNYFDIKESLQNSPKTFREKEDASAFSFFESVK
jgi:hypothetical protein